LLFTIRQPASIGLLSRHHQEGKDSRRRPELPPGAASSFFADSVKEGDILNVKAPAGHFFLDMSKTNPVVLIAGGVGVTPLLCMAQAIAASNAKRENLVFLRRAQRAGAYPQKRNWNKLAAENEHIHLHVCYSRPAAADIKGRDTNTRGASHRITKQLLPSSNFEYYLCGNGAFMKSITDGLEAWGVPGKDVHFEAFGPATVKKKTAETHAQRNVLPLKAAGDVQPVGQNHSLGAQRRKPAGFRAVAGVRIDSGLLRRQLRLLPGCHQIWRRRLFKIAGCRAEEGACLTCICRPKGDLVLDA